MNKAPEPPRHLSSTMRQWWRDLNAIFIFEAHQLTLLQLACEAYDRCEQARAALKKLGLTYTTKSGAPKARPEVSVERDSRLSFARLVRELSLSEHPPDEKQRPPRPPIYAPAKVRALK